MECIFNKLTGKIFDKSLKISEQSPKVIMKLITKSEEKSNVSSRQLGGSFYRPAKYIRPNFFLHRPKFYNNISVYWIKLLSSENSFRQVELSFCKNAQTCFKNPTVPLKTLEQITQITLKSMFSPRELFWTRTK